MAKSQHPHQDSLGGTDDSLMHDPLGQNTDVNPSDETEEAVAEITDTDEVQAAEEAAVNIDTAVAQEATNKTEETVEEREIEAELAAIEPEEGEKKHKNRESTSEKAKKAAAARAKKGFDPAAPKKQLDPLRLRGKKYREVAKLIDRSKLYTIEEAVALVKQTSTTKFDGSVELHAKVKGENIRGTISLPHGTGKTKKVAVADDATIEAISNGKLNFDVLVATPAQMPKLAKYAKVLGPKGLMPSPKAGTVTDDIEKVTKEISGGRMEYRADKTGVIHMSIGKISFKDEQLVENFKAMEPILLGAKVATVSLAPTMGPGVKVQLSLK